MIGLDFKIVLVASELIAAMLAVLLTAAPSRADETILLYNGSTIRWVSNDDKRVAYYLKLRPGLEKKGVRSGDVLFDGTKSERFIKGRAFSYKPGCHPFSFIVGAAVKDETAFALTGFGKKRKISGCDYSGRYDDYVVRNISLSSPGRLQGGVGGKSRSLDDAKVEELYQDDILDGNGDCNVTDDLGCSYWLFSAGEDVQPRPRDWQPPKKGEGLGD